MRVALVHYSAPPVVGGVERVVAQQAVLLSRHGHEVVVVAARGESPGPGVRFVRSPLVDSMHPEVLAVQAEVDAGHVSASFGELRDILVAELEPILAGFDVALCHNVCSLNKNLALTAALSSLAGRGGGPRLVLWHHDLAWSQPRYQPSLHAGYPWDLLRTAWPGVIQVAISETRRRELAALTGLSQGAIRVIPNGIDVAESLKLEPETSLSPDWPDIVQADPLLLMPVRIMPRKNIELGLTVVAAMRAAGRPGGLLVTGPGDPHEGGQDGYLAGLQRSRGELGIDAAVWFPGLGSEAGLPERVVADLYSVADVLFLPSRDEGFGIPALEAGLRRLPIVCSDLPALHEVAGDAALYIGPDDEPQAVAQRILARLDGDPVSSLAGRTRRQSSWEAIYRDGIGPLLDVAAR